MARNSWASIVMKGLWGLDMLLDIKTTLPPFPSKLSHTTELSRNSLATEGPPDQARAAGAQEAAQKPLSQKQ